MDMKDEASNAPASTSISTSKIQTLNVDPTFTVEDLIALEEENNEIKLENTMLVLELTHHAKLAELAGDDDQVNEHIHTSACSSCLTLLCTAHYRKNTTRSSSKR
jgi:hypothetical protein